MDHRTPPQPPRPLVLKDVPGDLRLYVPHTDGWTVHIQSDGSREYCYIKKPGEEWFHLLLPGEIYLKFGETKFCLNCAMRYGHITDDRLFWQNGPRHRPAPIA